MSALAFRLIDAQLWRPFPISGASHSYFGHDEFAAFAPGLKSLSDAEALRNQMLRAFEMAEIEEDRLTIRPRTSG